jgi:hypothetical protein
MALMVDIQLLSDALLTVAFTVGLAIALAITMVASVAVLDWHERKAGVRQVERYLASAAARQSPAATS